MMIPSLLSCGEHTILLELEDLAAVVALHRVLAADKPAGVTDLIPAARTVLIRLDPDADRAAVDRWVHDALAGPPAAAVPGDLLRIPVHYDGVDLAEAATAVGLTAAGLVALHTGTEFTVAFCGFAPGFGYLIGWPAELTVPRRATPRTSVPAGSVALAGEFTGVYPRASPGGWQLIGRTDLAVFDPERDPPALFTPGTRVRFFEAPA